MKKYNFEAQLKQTDSNLSWNYRIYVPNKICEKIFTETIKGNEKRVFCEINELIVMQAALTSDGNGGFYVMVNKENRKKANLEQSTTANVCVFADHSKYGIALPVEMETLLEQDDEGSVLFHKLTPGKQRSLLHQISSTKSEHTRIMKALTILEHLKYNQGKLDFKTLLEDFKNAKKDF